MIAIYFLEKNQIPFYIGKTRMKLNHRLSHHKLKFGEGIDIKLLEETLENEWKEAESYWIGQFRQWGFKLENKNNGGGGRKTHLTSKETREKIGKNQPKKKKPCSLERAQRISLANKGHQRNKGKKYNCTTYKPVLQYDLEGNFIKKWNSVKEILTYLDRPHTAQSIYRCVRGEYKKAYGFKWKYEN